MLSNRNCFKLLVKMISASQIARCPSFKFLTTQMQPFASWARDCRPVYPGPPCSQTSRTASTDECAQRFCVLTILPPVTALAVGLPAQRAIAQRFRALALFGRDHRIGECLLLREERKSGLQGPISVFGTYRTRANQRMTALRQKLPFGLLRSFDVVGFSTFATKSAERGRLGRPPPPFRMPQTLRPSSQGAMGR
jgi:hypothetical protein